MRKRLQDLKIVADGCSIKFKKPLDRLDKTKMEFCQKCGSVLEEKRKNFRCVRCGQAAKTKVKIESNETIDECKEIGVVDENTTDVFPVVAFQCGKCPNKEAYFWTSQTRAADETETKFFKCTKCKHTIREYK